MWTSADALRLGAAGAALMLAGCSAASPDLVVRNQRTGEVYFETPAAAGTEITLAWIHSIELTPWTETYEVRGNELVLTEVTLESYGAGAPSDIGGVTRIEDGVIHITELATPFEAVRWIHSHDTEHHVLLDGVIAVQTTDIPHHQFAEITIDKD